MAIQKSFDSPIGMTFPEAYWRIVNINIRRQFQNIEVTFEVFANETARFNGASTIFVYIYSISADQYESVLNGGLVAAYEAAKLDPIFAGCTDV